MILAHFPAGLPQAPILLLWTDSTPSKKWANKVTAASPQEHYLVQVYVKLLCQCNIGTNCGDWIDDISSDKASTISCPNPTLSDYTHCQPTDLLDYTRLKVMKLFPSGSQPYLTPGI
jgi:hypothetical protein